MLRLLSLQCVRGKKEIKENYSVVETDNKTDEIFLIPPTEAHPLSPPIPIKMNYHCYKTKEKK